MLGGMLEYTSLLIGYRNKQIESQLQDLRTLYDITNGLGTMMDEEKMLRYLISEAGFIPQQRDILYQHVNSRSAALNQDVVWEAAPMI